MLSLGGWLRSIRQRLRNEKDKIKDMSLRYWFASLVRILRAIRYRTLAVFGKAMLRCQHVRYGTDLLMRGLPILNVFPGSSIRIGDHVMLISYTSDTALGVNHAVKIETLAAGAYIVIGDHVGISGGSFCAQVGIEIGKGCLLGANVIIADTDFHSLTSFNRRYASEGVRATAVVIEENVFLGANVMVLKGVRIGANSVIGAGSVVTKTIPKNVIAAGNPCRVLRMLTAEELHGVG